jgi:hypothetical protein
MNWNVATRPPMRVPTKTTTAEKVTLEKSLTFFHFLSFLIISHLNMPGSPAESRCIIDNHSLNGSPIRRFEFFTTIIHAYGAQLHSVRDCISVSFHMSFKNLSYQAAKVESIALEVDKVTRVSKGVDSLIEVGETLIVDFDTVIPIEELHKFERIRGVLQCDTGESMQLTHRVEFCFSIHLPHRKKPFL